MASIAKIRGCVRGVSSEFVLACDMRFASRENTRLGQPEIGVGVNPGGGGTERLPLLVGRGSFDRRPIAAAKNLVNEVSLPSADQLLDGLNSFLTALTWPETQHRIGAVLKRGLQRDAEFEKRWPAVLNELLP